VYTTSSLELTYQRQTQTLGLDGADIQRNRTGCQLWRETQTQTQRRLQAGLVFNISTHPPTMPSLSRLFQRLTTFPDTSDQQQPLSYPSHQAPPSQDLTFYYLSTPLPPTSNHPAIRDTPSPAQHPIAIPPSTLLYTFTHPHPDHSTSTQFFLHCLPDPIGFLHHCVVQIISYLSPHFPQAPSYRHQSLTLILDPHYDGLAATSGGQLRVSLQWVDNVKKSVEQGREIEDATKEFKGVLLHELTHALQHDGFGSTPSWFTESIADWIRLRNGLGPRHWKKCGEAKREKGWETGYDVGAWFLDYLVGDGVVGGIDWNRNSSRPHHIGNDSQPTSSSTSTQPQAPAPMATQYTAPPANHTSPYPKARPTKPRPRPPIPDLVRMMDARLEHERWDENWWEQMAGAPLEVLWGEYLDYYS